MGEAYQCDRCGELHSGGPIARAVFSSLRPTYEAKSETNMELCKPCAAIVDGVLIGVIHAEDVDNDR